MVQVNARSMSGALGEHNRMRSTWRRHSKESHQPAAMSERFEIFIRMACRRTKGGGEGGIHSSLQFAPEAHDADGSHSTHGLLGLGLACCTSPLTRPRTREAYKHEKLDKASLRSQLGVNTIEDDTETSRISSAFPSTRSFPARLGSNSSLEAYRPHKSDKKSNAPNIRSLRANTFGDTEQRRTASAIPSTSSFPGPSRCVSRSCIATTRSACVQLGWILGSLFGTTRPSSLASWRSACSTAESGLWKRRLVWSH